jgi:3-oxoadipate enol-lactonase
VLLLSNSLGTDTRLWAPQLAAFSARFRVLCYDSRGHGASDAPNGAYSIERLARDVVELLDALGLERVNFCGLSQGGMVGQWLGAYAAGRIDRLVLANTAAYLGPASAWQERIDRVLEAGMSAVVTGVLERWFTPAFAARAPERVAALRAVLMSTPPVGYAGCCAALRDLDLRGSARSVSAPTLIVAGAFDPATPPERAAELAGEIPAAEVVTLDAAHLSNVEQPESFNRVVLEFLGAHA